MAAAVAAHERQDVRLQRLQRLAGQIVSQRYYVGAA